MIERVASQISRSRVLVLLAGGMLLFVLLAVVSYRSLLAVEEATDRRSDARQALLAVRALMSDLKDVENGQRSFILTGDPVFLAPYEDGLAQSASSFEWFLGFATPELLAEHPPPELRALIEARLALARLFVETRQREGFDAALAQVMGGAGRDAMERVHERFGQIDAALLQEIDRQDARMHRLRDQAGWQALGLGTLGVGLMLAAAVLLLRERKWRAQAEQALQQANLQLEDTVRLRTAQLQQARGEIETFARQLDRSIEDERRRLAREVHDQLGQVFTALKMTLNHDTQAGAADAVKVERMNRLLGEGIATARRIAAELRPPLLDDLGLAPALQHLAERFAEHSGIACSASIEGAEGLALQQATPLYRIAQEALSNVARHAQAKQVWIEGAACPEGYRLAVEDDGVGLGEIRSGASGLLNMRERAALAGGRLELESGRSGGLRVVVILPMEAA